MGTNLGLGSCLCGNIGGALQLPEKFVWYIRSVKFFHHLWTCCEWCSLLLLEDVFESTNNRWPRPTQAQRSRELVTQDWTRQPPMRSLSTRLMLGQYFDVGHDLCL